MIVPWRVKGKKPVAGAKDVSSLTSRSRASREVVRRVKATLFVLGGVAFFFCTDGNTRGHEIMDFGFGGGVGVDD